VSAAAAIAVRALPRVGAIPRATWDGVSAGAATPFESHGFLTALEDSGAVGTGWEPLALLAEARGAPVGVAVAYTKRDSWGEYVDDRAQAAAATAAGRPYYPKLVLAVPFTPVTGPRLIARADLTPREQHAVRLALLDAASDAARARGCHGLHLLRATPEDLAATAARGFADRVGVDYRWEDAGYADLDALLARFPSRRRASIRRERRRLVAAGVHVTHLAGAGIPDSLDGALYALYRGTADRYRGPGFARAAPLGRDFFALLWDRVRPALRLTLAWHGGRLVAGALDLEKDGRRFGRYWGSALEIDALHFEVCAYAPIEDCIARGVASFSAGPGGGPHKMARGFAPTRETSSHLLFDAVQHSALAAACARESAAAQGEIELSADRVFIR
jgi:hypothetical protein